MMSLPSEGVPRRCDPSWNHLARWILIYALPLGLLAGALALGAVGPDRDFVVPLLWGFLVPLWNTRELAGKPWVFKDFQARDSYPPTIAILHAAVWCLAIARFDHPAIAALSFAVFFLAYDGLLLRYRLLCIYGLPVALQRKGPLAVLAGFGVVWWGYLAMALAIVHGRGGDSPLAIAVAFASMVLPVQLILTLWQVLFRRPEHLEGVRRVAVIGAGWNGLYATKWLSGEGLDVVCFDQRPQPGGIWRYSEERPGGVFARTAATSSKHFLHASDLPFDEGDDFPTHQQVLSYLERYTRHFGLERRLRLGTRVVSAERQGDGWLLELESLDGGAAKGATQEELVDAVVVASGPQGEPRIDHRYRTFAGKISSAEDYKSAAGLSRGERVLVLGAGESAADIVAECVRAGASVHWSTHRGQWFADRHVGPYAADHFTATGARVLLGRFLNVEYLVRRFVIATFIRWAWGRGGHGVAVWEPSAPYLHQYLNKSRDAIRDVHWGRVVPHGPVRAIRGREVVFADGAAVFDRLIVATGYRPSWPFLERPPRHLYKLVFDPDDPSLAFVGFARPVLGSIPSLGEVQARWVARVLSGKAPLPSREARLARLDHDQFDHRRRFEDRSWLGALVDQESYSDELASYGGFQVRWLRLLWRPRALWTLLRSPWVAFKFHLHDSDPAVRRQVVDAVAREIPDRHHPLHVLSGGLGVAALVFIVGISALFFSLSPPLAFGTLALSSLLFGLLLRWSERLGWRRYASVLAEKGSPGAEARPARVGAPSPPGRGSG